MSQNLSSSTSSSSSPPSPDPSASATSTAPPRPDYRTFPPFTNENIREAVNDYLSGGFEKYPPIGMWDVSQVTDMSGLFLGQTIMDASGGYKADLSEWNVSKVTNMSHMFAGCSNFDGNLSRWNVSNVENMESMFEGCSSFKGGWKTGLALWKVQNVERMDRMFAGCVVFNSFLKYWRLHPTMTEKRIEEMGLETTIVMGEFYPQVYPAPQNILEATIPQQPNPHFFPEAAIPSLDLPNSEEEESGKPVPSGERGQKVETEGETETGKKAVPRNKEKRKNPGNDDDEEEDEGGPPPRKNLPPTSTEGQNAPPPTLAPGPMTHSPIRTNNQFLKKYHDYQRFIDFLRTVLRFSSPHEYDAYYSKINPSFFIQSAPRGLSFNDVPGAVFTNHYPFYAALKYLNTKLNPFKLDMRQIGGRCSEYAYGVHLNRLLYYYNVYSQLMIYQDLRDNDQTSGVIILCHGEFEGITEKTLPPDGHLKNIFICNKAPFGCLAYGHPWEDMRLTLQNNMGGKMLSSIEKFNYVPFDEIIDPLTGDFKWTLPSCRKVNPGYFEGAINYQLSTTLTRFLEKRYTFDMKEDDRINHLVLDVRRLFQEKSNYYIDEEMIESLTMTNVYDELDKIELSVYYDIIKKANVIKLPDNPLDSSGNPREVEFKLSTIISYYSKKVKAKNLFVFDTSCATNQLIKDKLPDHRFIMNVRKPFGTRIPRSPNDPTPMDIRTKDEQQKYEYQTGLVSKLAVSKQLNGYGRKRRRTRKRKHANKTKKRYSRRMVGRTARSKGARSMRKGG